MIPRRAVDLILAHEGFKTHPYWPGGASGITIGYGYDLAHHSLLELEADWIEPGHLAGSQHAIKELADCVGISGAAAGARVAAVSMVVVNRAAALEVFEETSLPKYEAEAAAAFPGIDDLPAEARGALVSLVFNRGRSMGKQGTASWDQRREMREVRDAVARRDLPAIAEAIRGMKRLWEGKGLNGLLARRDDEATLVEGIDRA